MKKKLIQILMLLVVAVSMGAFVSCKDSNEDDLAQLRHDIDDIDLTDYNLPKRLDAVEGDVEYLLEQVNGALGNYKTLDEAIQAVACHCGAGGGAGCTCDNNFTDYYKNLVDQLSTLLGNGGAGGGGGANGGDINMGDNGQGSGITLSDILGSLQDLLGDDGKVETNLAELIQIVNGHTTSIAEITEILGTHGTSIEQLLANQEATEISLNETKVQLEQLKEKVNAIKSCECNIAELWAKINELETGLTEAKTKALEALNLATEAKTAADAAKQIAELAQQAAADAAAAAATAQQAAEAAGATAQAAQTFAEGVKTIAEEAKTTAEAAKALAETLQAQVATNKEDIAKNKADIEALQTQITTVSTQAAEALQKAIEAKAKADVNEAAISALQTSVNANTTAITEMKTGIQELQSKVSTLENQVNTNTQDIASLKNSVSELTETVNTMSGTVSQLSSDYNTLKEKVNTLETELAAAKAECAANLEAAKAYTDAEIAAAKTTILAQVAEQYYNKETIDTKLSEITTKHNEDVEAINAAIAAIKQCTCDPAKIEDILERLAAAETNIGNNAEAIAANTSLINSIKEELTKLINDQIDEMKDKLEAVEGKVDDLKLVVDNLNYITPEEVEELLEALQNQVAAEIAALNQTDEDLKKRMDIIGDSVKTNFEEIVNLKALVNTLESTTVKKADYEADKAEILGKIDANETKIGELQDAVNTINDQITALQDDLDALTDRVKQAEDNLKTAMDDIKEIKEDVAAIQDYLSKQVTGIMIQGTRNPWFGTFALPVDVQSNILLAFYGKPTTAVEFPTYQTGNYVRADEALTEKDMEMINGVSVFKSFANVPLMNDPKGDGSGYAGKIYMTINPNTADVSGLQPKIVNSLDEESYITLDPITPSGAKLSFGFTRADQSSNGFYEADAYVEAGNVQKVNSPKFMTSAVADAMANARTLIENIAKTKNSGGNGAELQAIASDIGKVVSNMRFDRSGLKCSYTTDDGKEHSVYSQYNLAATAFQPLGLETLKDLHVETIPGYEKANNLLDRIANSVNSKVHTFFQEFSGSALVEKIGALNITNIEIKDLTEEQLALFKVSIDTTLWISGLKYHLDLSQTVNVPVKFTQDVSVPLNIDKDVSIDLSGVTVTTPTIVVTTDVKNTDGTAKLLVPVKDNGPDGIAGNEDDVVIGNAVVDLDQVDVKADATISGGSITLDGVAVGHITYNGTTTATVTVDQTVSTTVNIDKWIYFGDYELDDDGNIVPGGTNYNAKQFHLWVTRDMSDAAESLWGSAQSALGSVNDMLDDIRDIVKEVNNMIEKINSYEDKINDQVETYIDKIKGYLDKINSAVTGQINVINYRFQPFMLASTSKGLKRLSGSKNYPTKMASDITLFPTSQTFELFVPFARKHVAVTNVYTADLSANAQDGDATCLSKLQAVNTGKINTVVDGTVRQLPLRNLTKGYVYEVAYSALDFYGKMGTRKYYITLE